jgi:hypothetical protein
MQDISLKKIGFSEKKTKFLQPIIAKGFMGEPTRLDCVNIDNFFATVVGKSGKTQIKLKVKYVYCYDEETYQKLQKAFNSGDNDLLVKEWQQAKPITMNNQIRTLPHFGWSTQMFFLTSRCRRSCLV